MTRASIYDTMRTETRGLPAYKAIAVAKATPLVEAEQIGRACARFFLDPALSKKQATAEAMRAVTDAVGLRTKNAMRQTVKDNAVHDPAKTSFARAPTGATTCAFCSMMASHAERCTRARKQPARKTNTTTTVIA